MPNVEPIFIVGAGGIGCAVGHALATAGCDLTIVDVVETKLAWGRRHGLVVVGRIPQPARFVHFDDWQPPPGATVLLCTKCYDNAAVLPRLPPDVFLVPIQNGFDSALDQRGHAVEAIASFVSECLPDQTCTRITRRGWLHIGPRGCGQDERWLDLWQRLRPTTLFRVQAVSDILPYKHTKLMYNAAISPLAAAAGLDNGQLLAVPPVRQMFFELLRENFAILQGAGRTLARIGPFHPDTVQRILQRRWLAHSLAWAFYPTLRGSYCSMTGDLPKGRTEIDHYNGYLLELAGSRPCPVNRWIYDLVKRMERERLTPHRTWISRYANAPH